MKLSFSLLLLINISYALDNLTKAQMVNKIVESSVKFLNSSFINDKKIAKDTIAGTCEYESSNCNGANINLYFENEIIQSQVLTQNGGFSFTGLRPDQYKLEINFKRLKISQRKNVSPGEHIIIKLQPTL